jgi:DNA polymerase-3 subunit epsilon/ATP-dependent DNA helicase DinG
MLPRTFVAVDLETTGLDANRDAITEVGMVRFTLEGVEATYSQLVNPGRKIPALIERLTGIHDADVRDAPSFNSVRLEIDEFFGDAAVVGQNVAFDLEFLADQGVTPSGAVFDTLELVTLLDPGQGERRLGALAEHYGVPMPTAHRALADAETTRGVFLALYERARALPDDLLLELIGLGSGIDWTPAQLLEAVAVERGLSVPPAVEAPGAPTPGGQPALPGVGTAAKPTPPVPRRTVNVDAGVLPSTSDAVRPLAALNVVRPERVPAKTPVVKAVVEAVEGSSLEAVALEVLAAGRRHPEPFGEFEDRPEQVSMTQAVAGRFEHGGQLIVEAGTGTGKSLAYLIPAALRAMETGSRVVVSTNTINLQEQLLQKDVPALRTLLADALDEESAEALRAVTLKGRANYVCLRRVSQERAAGGESGPEARLLGRILIWLRETTSGDRSELRLRRDEDSLWPHYSAEGADCLSGGHCPFVADGSCFLLRSRKAAESAHVVIGNHALLLSDIGQGSGSLLASDAVVIDEAHHLEDSATHHLGASLMPGTFRELLDRIYRAGAGPRDAGLVVSIQRALHRVVRATARHDEVGRLAAALPEAVQAASDGVEALFVGLRRFVDAQEGDQFGFEQRMRVGSGLRAQPDWSTIEMQWETTFATLRAVDAAVEETQEALELVAAAEAGESDAEESEWDTLVGECAGFREALAERSELCGELLTQYDAERVVWLTSTRRSESARLEAAPLHVDALLKERLFDRTRTVVLTGATLAIDGTFDYLRQRLGLADADETLLGSPFDYRKAARLLLPNDMPEPSNRDYQAAVEEALVEMALASGGRMLVLFTSHGAIRATAKAIRGPLEDADIIVAAQGADGSPARVMAMLEENPRSVVLGTASLWEGVDVPGSAVSVVVIARLPFAVPSDPVYAARSEEYDDPFMSYAVPQAIVRFRQGFGRLIRRKDDRGVVAVLDGRITGKNYGGAFVRSLPPAEVRHVSVREFAAETSEWLER